MTKVSKAVFLDRDGTLNFDSGYLYQPEQLQLLPDVAAALATLNQAGFKVIVVTNQSGVGRGYYTEEAVMGLHDHMQARLAQQHAYIDAFYYCPHHPEATVERYRIDCQCRKPKPGMLWQAMKDFALSPAHSFMVGDRLSDVFAGQAAQCRQNIIIAAAKSASHVAPVEDEFIVVPGLMAAVETIIQIDRNGNQACK